MFLYVQVLVGDQLHKKAWLLHSHYRRLAPGVPQHSLEESTKAHISVIYDLKALLIPKISPFQLFICIH